MASKTTTQGPPASIRPGAAFTPGGGQSASTRRDADPSGAHPHGSISEKYLNETVSDVQDLVSIDLDALEAPPGASLSNTGGSGGAVAVAVGYKNATQLDPVTGAREIKPDDVDDLKLALRGYVVDALEIDHCAPMVERGTDGVSASDVDEAVDQAVTAASDSGQAALSLSLTGERSQQCHSEHPTNQGTTQTNSKTALSLTVSADGTLTGQVDRHTTQLSKGVMIVEGSASAPLPQNIAEPLYKSYDGDLYAFAPANELNKEPPGVEGTRTVSLSYVQGGTNTHIAPATGVRTEVVTSRSGSAHQTLRFDENGTTVLEAGSSEDNSAAPRASKG